MYLAIDSRWSQVSDTLARAARSALSLFCTRGARVHFVYTPLAAISLTWSPDSLVALRGASGVDRVVPAGDVLREDISALPAPQHHQSRLLSLEAALRMLPSGTPRQDLQGYALPHPFPDSQLVGALRRSNGAALIGLKPSGIPRSAETGVIPEMTREDLARAVKRLYQAGVRARWIASTIPVIEVVLLPEAGPLVRGLDVVNYLEVAEPRTGTIR